MDDLISRQAAMDICDTFKGNGSASAVIKGYIKALPPVEPKQESMTVEEYRKRMMDAFHNADCDELIALVVLPSEKEFEHLEWLLEKHYKAKPEPKQGKWIINLFLSSETSKVYNCSICNQLYMDNSFNKISYAHYCSNCGAKMEVGDENSN